jgi:dCTP deaminase
MKQLRDLDIVKKILEGKIVKNGLPDPYCTYNSETDKWYEVNSPVQPASLDLHVGEIYLPDKSQKSRDKYCLSSGQTVIITTSEELFLPSNISAFGFPPDNLSQNGIIMVNLGHIDPGWEGRIKFILINVGKEDYPIKKNDVVATFLFYELEGDVKVNYSQRRPNISFPIQPDIKNLTSVLYKDFLDVDKRANDIVKKTVNKNTVINSLIGTIAVALFTALGYFYSSSNTDKINDIDKQVQILRNDYGYNKLYMQVDSLKKKIDFLEHHK